FVDVLNVLVALFHRLLQIVQRTVGCASAGVELGENVIVAGPVFRRGELGLKSAPRGTLENVGIQMKRSGVVDGRLFVFLLGKIRGAAIAEVGSGLATKRDRLVINFDCLGEIAALVGKDSKFVIGRAEIVVGVGMFAIGLDGAFETFLGFLVALHHELADADFVVHRGAARRAFLGGIVEVDRVEEVFIRAQFVATLFEFFGRGPGSGRIGAVHGRRADF